MHHLVAVLKKAQPDHTLTVGQACIDMSYLQFVSSD